MSSQSSIAVTLLALAIGTPIGGQAWAQTRPTLQGLQDQINNTYTRQQVNNLVRTPDPACADNTNRYVDCLNGTVTDTVTGLIWLKQAACLGSVDYAAAVAGAATLQNGACGLTDGSRPGDWRLPTTQEWQSTLYPGPDCSNPSLTDTPGTGCFATGAQPFTGVAVEIYWSAIAHLDLPAKAWTIDLHYSEETSIAKTEASSIRAQDKAEPHWVWPVRGAASSQPVYPGAVIRGQVSEGIVLASGAKAAVSEYYLTMARVPADNAAAGLETLSGPNVTQVSIVNGRVDVTYGNAADAAITGKTLSLTPYEDATGANITWRCGNAAAPSGWFLLGTSKASGGSPVAVYQETLIDNTYLPTNCRP